MNYPIWDLDTLGGPTLIALIAVVHSFVAQFAVGGGLFLWLTDAYAQWTNDDGLRSFVRRHTKYFLMITMVFGGVTGVGIWFVIALVHPSATSMLIHSFVFGWAIEWVFFAVEIVALLIYHYRFDALKPATRLKIAFIYAFAAWASLFTINGILSFMLTPGKWVETHGFWDGFFNPTFWPSLVYRTFVSAMLAGLFAFITASATRDDPLRGRILNIAKRWLLWPAGGIGLSAWWYFSSIPEDMRSLTFIDNPETAPFAKAFLVSSAILFILGVLTSRRLPRPALAVMAILLIATGLTWAGGFEYMREIARKPWVISNVMYSNGITPSEVAGINENGILATAKWVKERSIGHSNKVAVGREIFDLQCASCHTVDGMYNAIKPRTGHLTTFGAEALLEGLGAIHPYMPPFLGNEIEREALAHFLVVGLHDRAPSGLPEPKNHMRMYGDAPKCDEGDHVLLAWNDLGMHCISDSEPYFIILPPGNTIEATLVEKGEQPKIITEGVTLHYAVEDGLEDPANEVRFWDYAKAYFGREIPRNVGISGNGMSGTMTYSAKNHAFVADHIPVVPYRKGGEFVPYPKFTIRAIDNNTSQVLATTEVVAPVSTEMGCKSCHAGSWRNPTGAGISDDTARNILALHDRNEGTTLLADAEAGRPRFCQECHADPALGMEGQPDILNLSTAMHGWHAHTMTAEGSTACASCHPSHENGPTRCQRGIHKDVGLDCTDCHGTLDDHAAGLLRGENDKVAADRLLAGLQIQGVGSIKEVNGRRPWRDQPDCLSCHVNYEKPKKGVSAFNKWDASDSHLYRNRIDGSGLRCEACHGSPHALYPSDNPTMTHLDNLQPRKYQESPYPIGSNYECATCHGTEMEAPIHHRNMLRDVRHEVTY